MSGEPLRGPVEANEWPDALAAHVVDVRGPPRIHGYGVASDLARHYAFHDTVFLSLTGELPNERSSRLLSIAFVLASARSVVDGPAHAATLARVCGAPSVRVLSAAAITLGEAARWLAEQSAPLIAWMRDPSQPPPEEFRGRDTDVDAQRDLVDTLATANIELPALRHPLALAAHPLVLLVEAGLDRPEHLEAVLTLTGLSSCFAEAWAITPARFREYAMNVPPFLYEAQPR